jgi:UDP-N-acetylmuramate dehydrogenase
MAVERTKPSLADNLPKLQGRIQADVPLGPQAWFRVGGPAEALVKPSDTADLAAFLKVLPYTVPVRVVGAASNLIIRDGGIAGVVLRLARGFAGVSVEGTSIIAGAGALDATIAEHAAASSIAGLEFLSGIPGMIGGGVAMNAGAYGNDMAEVLEWAELVTRTGEIVRLQAHEFQFAYRTAHIAPGAVVVRACLRGVQGDKNTIIARMAGIRNKRESTQPTRARTGGSTFRNPPDMKAWELIDAAGCRGMTRGGAAVSEKHCNFLLNVNRATAADLEGLGEEVRDRVRTTSGVELEWEIHRIGIAGPPSFASPQAGR